MDDASIERLAEQELLQEAQRGAARASVDGPAGWQKCPLPKTNKRFLHNTILHTLQSNRASARSGRIEKRRGESKNSETRVESYCGRGRTWTDDKNLKSGGKTLDVQRVGKKSDKNVPDGKSREMKANISVQGSSRQDVKSSHRPNS